MSTLAGSPGNYGSQDGVGSDARFYNPWGMIIARDGCLYVCDYSNEMIRKVTLEGEVTTVLSGTHNTHYQNSTSYSCNRTGGPSGIAELSNGDMIMSCYATHQVKKWERASDQVIIIMRVFLLFEHSSLWLPMCPNCEFTLWQCHDIQ